MAKSLRKGRRTSASSNPLSPSGEALAANRMPGGWKTPAPNYNAMQYIKSDIFWSIICALVIVILMAIFYFLLV
jgi:hypothetical protein